MSYRSIIAQYVQAASQTKRYTVTLAQGEVGIIAAANNLDAQREAVRWAKYRKSSVVAIQEKE